MSKRKPPERLTPIPKRRPRAKPDAPAAPAGAPDAGPDLSHIAPGLLKPEVVPLADLAFMTGNAVKHPEKQVAEIGASIKQFQQVELLVVNRRETPPVVIGGNGRLQALLAAGLTHAAVCFVDLDRAKANALSLALNRTADGRLYDREALDALLRDVNTNADPVLDQMLSELATQVGVVPGAEGNKPHVANNSGEQEWYTPADYLDAARQVLGGIDLDPATSEVAQQRVRAASYFTAEQDGLSQPWEGRVWMNPPYAAGLVDRFIAKLADHYRAGDVPAAVVLVNNATDTGWFRQGADAAAAICFPTGRVRFLDPDGDPSGAPLQGQAVLYLGPDAPAFCEAFAAFGFCVAVEKAGAPAVEAA